MAKAKHDNLYGTYYNLGEIDGFKHGMIETNKVLAEVLESNIRQVKKTVGKFKVTAMSESTKRKLEYIDRVLFELADDAGVLGDRVHADEAEWHINKRSK